MIDVQLTEDEFDAQFGYVPGPDGGFYHDLDTDRAVLTRAHEERRLWTAVDGNDGEDLLVSGFAFVNRFAYVIAARPYSTDVGLYLVTLERL